AAPHRPGVGCAWPRRRHRRRDACGDRQWRHAAALPLRGGDWRQGRGSRPAHAWRGDARAPRAGLCRARTARGAGEPSILVAPAVGVSRAARQVMKPARFDYYRAGSIADATGVLAELREDAAVLAGGLSLGPMLNLRLVRPRAVIDITRGPRVAPGRFRNGRGGAGARPPQAGPPGFHALPRGNSPL